MRALKVAVLVMAILIVLGTTTLVVLIVKRLTALPPPPLPATTAMLHEPAGSRIVGLAGVGGLIAVALSGGGPDRVVLIDPHTGQMAGNLTLGP